MAYLAEYRNRLKIPAKGVVEIRVDLQGDEPAVFLECAPCEDELVENRERSLFECGNCGYTMTPEEANSLARDHVQAVSSVFDVQRVEERKGLRWLLATLFGSRKKRRALTS